MAKKQFQKMVKEWKDVGVHDERVKDILRELKR